MVLVVAVVALMVAVVMVDVARLVEDGRFEGHGCLPDVGSITTWLALSEKTLSSLPGLAVVSGQGGLLIPLLLSLNAGLKMPSLVIGAVASSLLASLTG